MASNSNSNSNLALPSHHSGTSSGIFKSVDGKTVEIRDVWAYNLEEEMEEIRIKLEKYKYISMVSSFFFVFSLSYILLYSKKNSFFFFLTYFYSFFLIFYSFFFFKRILNFLVLLLAQLEIIKISSIKLFVVMSTFSNLSSLVSL